MLGVDALLFHVNANYPNRIGTTIVFLGDRRCCVAPCMSDLGVLLRIYIQACRLPARVFLLVFFLAVCVVAPRSWLFCHFFGGGRCVSALHLDTLNKQRTMLLVQNFMADRTENMRPEWISTQVRAGLVYLWLSSFTSGFSH